MKSSTIRRSNLSKEKLAVLEALSKLTNKNSNNTNVDNINPEPQDDGSPEVYVRPNKEKELDLLWQNFRMPKVERSPIVYLGSGFVAGVITTLVVSGLIGLSVSDIHPSFKFKFNFKMPTISAPAATKASKISFLPSSNTTETTASEEQQADKEYTVQSGDTMEGIVRKFYGNYSTEKVNAVMKANNMTDPNKLGIGQKLVIPMGETSAETTDTSSTDSIPTEEQ